MTGSRSPRVRLTKRDLASSMRLAFDVGYEAGVNRAPRKQLRIVRKSAVDRLVMELVAAETKMTLRCRCTGRERGSVASAVTPRGLARLTPVNHLNG
jgi:hypothetical protein